MYTDRVRSIYIHKSKLIFKDEFGIELNSETEVGDLGIPLTVVNVSDNTKNIPDFAIRGFFRKVDHHSKNEFIVSDKGPDVILITGVPKSYPSLEPFRYKDPKFTSYWEDSVKGVLFQVFSLIPASVLLPIVKQQSILQL